MIKAKEKKKKSKRNTDHINPWVNNDRVADTPNPLYNLLIPPADNRVKMCQGVSRGERARALRWTFAFTKSIGSGFGRGIEESYQSD